MDANIADYVLTHVVDGWVDVVGCVKLDGMESDRGVDGQVRLCGNSHAVIGWGCGDVCRRMGGVEVGHAPAVLYEASIVGLATINLGEGDGRARSKPTRVRDDSLVRAGRECQVESRAQQVRSRGIAEADPSHGRAVPSAAEQNAECVCPMAEE